MTERTDSNSMTPIEKATVRVLQELSKTVSMAYIAFEVGRQHGTTEPEFRRIIALYFHDKTITDWCHDLAIADATDPADKPSHGGER